MTTQGRKQAEEAEARRKQEAEEAGRQARRQKASSLHWDRVSVTTDIFGDFDWLAWVCPLVLLAGGGISVGVLSQLWPWAVGAVVGLGILAYLGGYQHMITLSRWGVLLLLSGAIAFSITWLLGPVPYAHIDLRSGQSIGHQIIFGAVIGGIAGAAVGVYVARWFSFTGSNIVNARLGAVALLALLGAFIILVVVSALGSLFSWGYGYGYGWSYALLVGIPALFVGMTGLVSSVYICWRASNSRLSRRHTP